MELMNVKLRDHQELAKNPRVASKKPWPRNLSLLVSQPDPLAAVPLLFWQAHTVFCLTANPLSQAYFFSPLRQLNFVQLVDRVFEQGPSASPRGKSELS